MIVRKSAAELAIMARAGAAVARLHEVLREAAVPGTTTADLDRIAVRELRDARAAPSFKGYQGFPATLCTSVGDEVVHGIPSPDRVLRAGDVLKIDAGAVVDGYHADSAVTWVIGDDPDPAVHRLVEGTRQSLWAGLRSAVAGGHVGDVAAAVGTHARGLGLGVVAGYVGHGVGRALHEDPPVPNEGRPGRGARLDHGLVVAIEPMCTLGGDGTTTDADDWTVRTADGSLSAHWEHTVAITPDGPWVLTARADEPARPDPVSEAEGAAPRRHGRDREHPPRRLGGLRDPEDPLRLAGVGA